MIYEREVVRLSRLGKVLLVLGAPIALSGAFLSTFALEMGTALIRATWELRWEWRKIRDFMR